jgi:GNAT superfamily N-acetyltransferase
MRDFDDIKTILAGEDGVWRRFAHAIGNGLACARVARYDDKIAGYLTVTRQSARHVEAAVYVDVPYRRRGVGSQLLLSADHYMLNSAYEHARCVITADEGAAEFLSRNGYRLYCPVYDMERGASPIDGDRLCDTAPYKRDIRIRPYQDADYMAWHTICDVAYYLLREKLGLVPGYYQPPSEYERRRLNTRRDT